MIKTLRITSIIAVVLAVVFFAFPAVVGVRGDEQIEQFLNSTGAIEEFRQARGNKIEDKQHETSPLVKQAEAFALYLNPPPKPDTPAPSAARSEIRPKSVTPKFRLVGTSRHELRPEMSLALIDEPGKGLRWVKAFSTVGHLAIEQVKDGLVVVRDGDNTFELVAERTEKRSLIKTDSTSGGSITGDQIPEIIAEVQLSAEEEAALMKEAEVEREKMLTELGNMQTEMNDIQADIEDGENNSEFKNEDVETPRRKAITDIKNMRISDSEAKGLGRMGRRLKNVKGNIDRGQKKQPEIDANAGDTGNNNLNLHE